MRKLFILISIIMMSKYFGQTLSQSPTIDMFPKSPDAAALSKHVDIPPGSYTGVANFTIPIYTINANGINIPIELNYTTTGIKVGEISSRVGLGWSLNTGVSLSQQVIGSRDTGSRYRISQNFDPTPEMACTITGDYGIAMAVTMAINDIIPNSVIPNDIKPDIYSYSLLNGKNGKFIMDAKNKTGIPMPYNQIKIKQPYNYFQIDVTDDVGIQYTFNDYINTLRTRSTCTDPSFEFEYGVDDPNYKVTKIITPTNEEIKYIYDTDIFYGSSVALFVSSVSTQKRINVAVPNGFQYPPLTMKEKCINYTRSKDSPLKEINFEGGKVLFTYTDKNIEPRLDINGDVYLTGIVVQNTNGDIIKDFTLIYDYFYSSGGVPSVDGYTGSNSYSSYLIGIDKRLKLISVKDNLTNGIYHLEYYETYNEKTLPNRISNDQDFWGVYNGKENGKKSISNSRYAPPTNVTSEYFGADKNADINYGRLGNLKKIIYPTGGYTEVQYEADEFDLPQPEVIYEYSEEDFSYEATNLATPPTKKEFTITENPINQKIELKREGTSTITPTGPCVWKLLKPDGTVEQGPIGITTRNDLPGDYKLWVEKDEWGAKCTATYSWTDFVKTPVETIYSRNAGTIRINNIKSVDNAGNSIIRSYTYKEPTSDYSLPYTKNSGKNLGEELYISRYIKKFPVNLPVSDIGATATETWASNNPGWQTATVRGKSVGYDFVQEYYIDSKNPSNFYRKEYAFQNDEGSTYHNPDTAVNVTWPMGALNRGLILGEMLFDSANKLIMHTINEYDYDPYFNNNYSPQNYVGSGHTMGFGLEIVTIKRTKAFCPSAVTSIYDFDYTTFPLDNYWIKNIKTTTTDYINNQPTLVKEQTSAYSTSTQNRHTFPIEQKAEVIGSGISSSQHFQYAYEKGNTYLTDKNMVGIPLETETKKNGKTISKTETIYPTNATDAMNTTMGFPLPKSVKSYNVLTGDPETEVTYDEYDNRGNLRQYTTKDGISVAIIWGYDKTQPIAKIVGAKHPSQMAWKTGEVPQSLIDMIVFASDDDANDTASGNPKEQVLVDALDAFRKDPLMKDYQITTYTYDPLIGVRSITPPNGVRQVYIYDTANRLKEVREQSQTGNILKEYEYHYKP